MNTRMVIALVVIALGLAVCCQLFVAPVSAYAPRIEQGGKVYVGGYYDITGVTGWDSRYGNGTQIAYCNGYDCYDYGTPYLLKLPLRTRVENSETQYNFYIDPDIFLSRPGYWYQYDEKLSDKHGNTVAFYVIAAFENSTDVNGTVINSTIVVGNITGMVQEKPYILEERKVSDYLLARGDTLFIDSNESAKIWMFGRLDGLYDVENNGMNLTFNESTTGKFETGGYRLLTQTPGKNGEWDVRFFDDKVQRKDGWNGIASIGTLGYDPGLILTKTTEALDLTDDKYTVKKLEIQDPAVTIEGFDEVQMTSNYTRYEEYRLEEGFISLFDVRGYTNLKEGTEITLVLDPDKHTPRDIQHYTFTTVAQRSDIGSMSYYQVYVPIIWSQMGLGMHTMVVSAPLGAKMYYDFPISVLPADSFKPNASIKYVVDRNPWVPTPTPEVQITIVEKEVIVERTIEIPVTPSPDVVREQQADVVRRDYVEPIVYILLCLIFIGWGSWYVYDVLKRARLK